MNENYIKASRIMEHYGAQHQLTKLCEECGELIAAASHFCRNPEGPCKKPG